MYNNAGSPTLTNVTFSGNIAGSSATTGLGAGMYIESGSPKLTNVTFTGNIAEFGGYGGGMNNYGSPKLTNVTFNKNTAGRGGGMDDPKGTSEITNTIFWGNTGTNSANEIYYGSSPKISYSVVQGGFAGATNIATDPLLGTLGNYGGSTQTIPIQSGSSAIDMGDATKCPATDQRGQARVGVCDIGAYEYNPGGGTAAANTASGAAKKLPTTGFAPNRITTLPSQPEGAAYRPMGALWLEIPSQNVKANIVGVPEVDNNWDVTWLGADAGWLNETAFPTWAGNSVITAHVTDANGLPGPFANLKVLAYGNKIVVHQFGEKYTFEVRQSRMVFPDTSAYAFEHLSGNSYLTLITCQGYNFLNDSYMFRRVVRAVLVSVEAE